MVEKRKLLFKLVEFIIINDVRIRISLNIIQFIMYITVRPLY